MTEVKSSTEQVEHKGNNPNGKGGFGDNPQNRNPGGWNKDESISYQYNKLMRMSPNDLADFMPETVAQEIALTRIKQARSEKGLLDAKEITDRTEGKAKETIQMDLDAKVEGRVSPELAAQFAEFTKQSTST